MCTLPIVRVSGFLEQCLAVDERGHAGPALPQRRLGATQWPVRAGDVRRTAVLRTKTAFILYLR